jgi:Ca2+-transporting ATPase
MLRRPRKPSESITGSGLLGSMVGIGLLMAAVTIGLFLFGRNDSLAEARTMAFAALSFLQMAHVLNCKSLKQSLFQTGLRNNLYLVAAVLLTGILQYLVTEVSWLQRIFYTTGLTPAQWLLVIGLALLPIVAVECRKRFQPV